MCATLLVTHPMRQSRTPASPQPHGNAPEQLCCLVGGHSSSADNRLHFCWLPFTIPPGWNTTNRGRGLCYMLCGVTMSTTNCCPCAFEELRWRTWQYLRTWFLSQCGHKLTLQHFFLHQIASYYCRTDLLDNIGTVEELDRWSKFLSVYTATLCCQIHVANSTAKCEQYWFLHFRKLKEECILSLWLLRKCKL